MFDELKHSLTLLLKENDLSSAADSYVANGKIFSLKKDDRNNHLIIQFSLLSKPDFESLVIAVKRTIVDYGFSFKEIEKATEPINKITLTVCENFNI